MENRDRQSPETSQQNKQQQPTAQSHQAPTDGKSPSENGQPGGAFDSQQPSETGQVEYGQSGQNDTLTQQRSDIEGSAGQSSEQASDTSGFIGQQGGIDSSSELVEDDQDFKKDGQGSIEGQ